MLQRKAVGVLERAELSDLYGRNPKQEQDRQLEPLVDQYLAVRADFGHARCARVQQPDRRPDDLRLGH